MRHAPRHASTKTMERSWSKHVDARSPLLLSPFPPCVQNTCQLPHEGDLLPIDGAHTSSKGAQTTIAPEDLWGCRESGRYLNIERKGPSLSEAFLARTPYIHPTTLTFET